MFFTDGRPKIWLYKNAFSPYPGTADFSKFIISETITCNSITLVIENITALWDLVPSFIEFYLSTTEINDTKVTRFPAQYKPDTISANFSVKSNSSYSVWAVPVTYWGNNQSQADLNGSCENSRNCLVGERTPVKVVTTLRRQRKYNKHQITLLLQITASFFHVFYGNL